MIGTTIAKGDSACAKHFARNCFADWGHIKRKSTPPREGRNKKMMPPGWPVGVPERCPMVEPERPGAGAADTSGTITPMVNMDLMAPMLEPRLCPGSWRKPRQNVSLSLTLLPKRHGYVTELCKCLQMSIKQRLSKSLLRFAMPKVDNRPAPRHHARPQDCASAFEGLAMGELCPSGMPAPGCPPRMNRQSHQWPPLLTPCQMPRNGRRDVYPHNRLPIY